MESTSSDKQDFLGQVKKDRDGLVSTHGEMVKEFENLLRAEEEIRQKMNELRQRIVAQEGSILYANHVIERAEGPDTPPAPAEAPKPRKAKAK